MFVKLIEKGIVAGVRNIASVTGGMSSADLIPISNNVTGISFCHSFLVIDIIVIIGYNI